MVAPYSGKLFSEAKNPSRVATERPAVVVPVPGGAALHARGTVRVPRALRESSQLWGNLQVLGAWVPMLRGDAERHSCFLPLMTL